MNKKLLLLMLIPCLMISMLISACGSRNHNGELEIYYLNLEATEIQLGYFDPTDYSGNNEIDVYLDALASEPNDSDLLQTIPSTVKVNGYRQEGIFLIVDFSEDYNLIPRSEEVLIRAAIVKTLTQATNVNYVSFTVAGNPLQDARGNEVGSMSADSFVENSGYAINKFQDATLTLYFATPDGQYLESEKQTVRYSSNESLEKVVVRKLIEGPDSSGFMATIPSSTNLITVSVNEGICYVNLTSDFLNQNMEIREEVVLYSIVDSLAELPDVDMVQLQIDGDTTGFCRYIYPLSDLYSWDDTYFYSERTTEGEE